MKKLYALLFALLTFAAYADVTFTVNGVPVPANQVSGTIAITTGTTPPPTCTGGQVWNGSACVCPAGSAWSGTVCVISPPPSGNYELREINWPTGNSYIGKPIQSVAGATVAAYRISAQQLLNAPSQTPNTGRIQFYESGTLTACISNVPGKFYPFGGITPCINVIGPNSSAGWQFAGSDYPASDSALAGAGWKRLPPVTDGYYYINVKLPDPAGLPSIFWLLYN